jgi:hypothetical protein
MTAENGLEADQAAKRAKGRSPLYPAINLETAIQRVRQLYEKERLHATPVATIATHWNYKSLNGPAAQTLAALKKYGLIQDEGAGKDRKARISPLADVIVAHPDEAMRKSAIQNAALQPTMHRELWDKYHEDLPSDSNLRWELTHDRGFTETGASEFIPVYRATVAFAQLASHVPEPAQEQDQNDAGKHEEYSNPATQLETEPERPRPVHTGVKRSYDIPLIDSGAVTVEGQFPISEQDWAQLMAVLAAMKPGLVKSAPVSSDAE